jgi:hypothetical protein
LPSRRGLTAAAQPSCRCRAGRSRPSHERAVAYLVGTPNLADELEEGLARLGLSVEDVEEEHL